MQIRFSYPALLAISFILFLSLHQIFLHKTYFDGINDSVIKITKGDNLTTVAEMLQESRIIYSKYFFIIAGKLYGLEEKIIPGEYKLSNGLTSLNLLELITDKTKAVTYTLTVPEGMNIRQIGRLVSRHLNLDSAKFVRECSNDSLIKSLGVDAQNLEGFLFPDTYQIILAPGSNNEGEIVKMLVNQFTKRISGSLTEEIQQKKMKLKDVITMASIVDAETNFSPEMKTIAGVYYNRLKRGMRLEADPTVQYVLPGGTKRRLMYSDLKFPSPYNTYLHKGLPPGPINNPGIDAINSAVFPEQNKYFYFAAKGDGSHRFAETYEEHKKNAAEYRKYLDELEKSKEKSKEKK